MRIGRVNPRSWLSWRAGRMELGGGSGNVGRGHFFGFTTPPRVSQGVDRGHFLTRIARWDGRNRVTFDTSINTGDLKLHLDDIRILTGKTGTIRGGGHGDPVTGAFRYDPETQDSSSRRISAWKGCCGTGGSSLPQVRYREERYRTDQPESCVLTSGVSAARRRVSPFPYPLLGL